MMDTSRLAFRKPEPLKRTRARKRRAVHAHVRRIRGLVFHAADTRCVVCGHAAESLHEVRPASVVGSRVKATTLRNSIPVCGDGVRQCHGFLQRHEIQARHTRDGWRFTATTRSAVLWLQLRRLAALVNA